MLSLNETEVRSGGIFWELFIYGKRSILLSAFL
jgi:hypothetical protein